MADIVSLCDKRKSQDIDRLRDALPPSDTKRWVARRKAAVVAALAGGALCKSEAMERYGLSAEELQSWCDSAAEHGVFALYATRLQHYRNTHEG